MVIMKRPVLFVSSSAQCCCTSNAREFLEDVNAWKQTLVRMLPAIVVYVHCCCLRMACPRGLVWRAPQEEQRAVMAARVRIEPHPSYGAVIAAMLATSNGAYRTPLELADIAEAAASAQVNRFAVSAVVKIACSCWPLLFAAPFRLACPPMTFA